jgi:hypothetical protein
MAFELVLEEPPFTAKSGAPKGVSQVFFSNLPQDYKVFLLYFRGAMGNPDLEDRLVEFGKQTGHNLLVNLCSANDPNYDMISERFDIRKFPAIIVTAVPSLAAAGDEYLTTFAKLDNTQLLSSPERTIQCAEELFHLFIRGKVAEAASKAKWAQRAEVAGAVAKALENALKAVGSVLARLELSFSVLEGKFELKYSGD